MKRGMSLIEVIVPTTLLGVLGSILLLFFLSTAQPQRQASHREFALCLASQRLEEAKSQSAQALAPGTYPPDTVTSGDGCQFVVALSVEKVNGFTAEELRHLVVQVTWKEKKRPLLVEQSRYACDASF